ncbi:MAG: hypothetical protein DWQ31_18310 [Planctomycetota bacterium]|nr:MAG: hypothetical protein DWQ31_18310 [Planctomycetota bacterium]REJ87318.1 MAG: hypothetical protein DWQ35_21650 [Planctomycetota bacterium]REK22669.1 MAG: hypothetical protein DWQ42_16595 [Planctomycetota bacterium]REK42498.1 MAG: hypothetical protein DWQ46_12995 [Planctomycetota bacterium]
MALEESLRFMISNIETNHGNPVIVAETIANPEIELVKVQVFLLSRRADGSLLYRTAFAMKQEADVETHVPDIRSGEGDMPQMISAALFSDLACSQAIAFFVNYEELTQTEEPHPATESNVLTSESFEQLNEGQIRDMFVQSHDLPLTVRSRSILYDRALSTSLKRFIRGSFPGAVT